MVCLNRPYHFKFFNGCLPQILLGPFFWILCPRYVIIVLQQCSRITISALNVNLSALSLHQMTLVFIFFLTETDFRHNSHIQSFCTYFKVLVSAKDIVDFTLQELKICRESSANTVRNGIFKISDPLTVSMNWTKIERFF